MRRLRALQDQYRQHPPVQAMVQAYMEIEPSDSLQEDWSDEEIEAEIEQLVAAGLVH